MQIALSLGGNLGDVKKTFDNALTLLKANGICDLCKSLIIKTKPINCPNNSPDFFNMAVTGEWHKSPEELLVLCKKLEKNAGRDIIYERNAPRPLDIDIILFGDCIIKTKTLIIPHIEAHRRLFVLEPLSQIARNWIFPDCNKSVDELLNDLSINIEVVNILEEKQNMNCPNTIKTLPLKSQERKMRYRASKPKWGSLCGEILCRKMLKGRWGREISNLEFDINKNGKPYFLTQPHIFFNISHSNKFATCATSKYEVGIDIEDVDRNNKNFAQIAKRFFSQEEIKIVEQYGIDAFLKIWTMKEAYLKAIGVGITIPLNTFTIPFKSNKSIINNKTMFFNYSKTEKYHLSICSEIELPINLSSGSTKR